MAPKSVARRWFGALAGVPVVRQGPCIFVLNGEGEKAGARRDVARGASMTEDSATRKPIVFTTHARKRTVERGAREEDVIEAIRIGEREPAQRDLVLYRMGGIIACNKSPLWWRRNRSASSS